MRKPRSVDGDVNAFAPRRSKSFGTPVSRAAALQLGYSAERDEADVSVEDELIEVATPSWRKRLKLLAPLLLLVVIAAVWYYGDLGQLNSPEKIAQAARSLRESPWAPLYVILAFSIGSLLFFPITALMAATALSFDAKHGFLYSYVGALFAAALTYWAGRLLGSDILAYVRGPKLERFQHELRTHAFRASIAARFVPVGSFAVLNMLAGSLHVPFRAYVLGNMVGILPGAALLTLFADQLASALWNADRERVILLGLLAALTSAWWFYRRHRRRRAAKLERASQRPQEGLAE